MGGGDAGQGRTAGVSRRLLVLGAIVLPLLMSACGFHLRGAVSVPETLQPIHVVGGGRTAVGGLLVERLDVSGTRLTSDARAARVRIEILNESRSSRVAAVDRNGKVLAYELRYQFQFVARGDDGEELIAPQTISVTRTLDNPNIEVLGKQAETEMVFDDMQRESVEILLARLSASLT